MLFEYLLKKLSEMDRIIIYGCKNANIENHTSTIAINVKNADPKQIEQMLLDKYNIVVRAGYHCSSCTHYTIGTLETGGAIRLSLGYTNTIDEIDDFIRVMEEIIELTQVKK